MTDSPQGRAPRPGPAPSTEADPLLAELFPPAPQAVAAPHSPPPGAPPAPPPGAPSQAPPAGPPLGDPPGPGRTGDPSGAPRVWAAPTRPVEDLPHDEYYARKPAVPSITAQPEPWQGSAASAPARRRFPVAPVAVALLVAAGLGFAAMKFFFTNEPFVYTGADGEISRVPPKRFLRPLVGYQYQAIPKQSIDQMIELLRSQDPEGVAALEEGLLKIDARRITQGGAPIGGVIVMAIKPEMMADQGEREAALGELEKQLRELERVEMGDKVAYTGSGDQGAFAVSFYENLLVMVGSPSEGTSKTLANELLAHAP